MTLTNERNGTGTGGDVSRRSFLSRLTMAAGGLVTLLAAIPVVTVTLEPLLRRRPMAWRAVGKPDVFEVGKTVRVEFEDAGARPWAGRTGRTAAWLRRKSEQEFIAFSVDCTHLGCPVRWEPGAQLFLCPCHGGVYYVDGRVAGGPPPRPLVRYPVRVNQGQVEIKTEPLPISG
jgi:menaquinol-cytochrome c reductase iron-sulfur subunit